MNSQTRTNPMAGRTLIRPARIRYDLVGELGRRLDAVTRLWLLPVPLANTQILEVFRIQVPTPVVNTLAFFRSINAG